MNCFYSVSGSQISWGDSEKSPALQDVLHHMNDITALWIETQNEYIGEYLLTLDIDVVNNNLTLPT